MAQTTTAPPRQSLQPETDPFAERPGSDRGRVVFTAAVGLIAVHVIDDSFLQPQPGTSAGDHLFSGLIPLAILAVAVWAYPRVRAGARAAMALSLVVPAVLSGAEAISYGGKTGLSGDDYTGLLALAAAPVLLVLGVWTLWTSRRVGDRLARRYGRRLLKAAAVLVAAPLVLVPLSISYVGSHVSRAEVPEAELGAAYEDVTLETSDGLELEGWYVPSRNRAAVIVFPGRTGAQKQARMLVRHGYGVLLYDRRGEGHSEGDPNSFGWDFDKDIRAGIDFLAQLDDVSGFAKLPTALTYGVRDLANSVFQDRLPPRNLMDLVPKIAPQPVFLIHAGDDDAGHRNPDYFRAAKEPKQIWEAEGGHTDGIDEQPEEYERRVVAFFDGALPR